MSTGPFVSALYDGAVFHKRLKPRRHSLRYRLFWMLLDIDELEALGQRLRLFSHNRANLFSFVDRDHLGGSGALRAEIAGHFAAAGLPWDSGSIRLLCVPRILGHAFNPLSVYFCHRRDGAIAAVLYEVNNTFGQRHCYLAAAGEGGVIRQSAEKAFYVSPFLDMDLRYAFRIEPPGETVSVSVNALDEDGPVIATNFSGVRRPLSDATLLRAFVAHPLMTLKVVVGIHWEALRLWRKGLGLRSPPAPPSYPVTLGRREG